MAGARIDIHPHLISPDTEKYPLAPLGGVRSAWSESSHSLTADQLVAAMDEAGIDKAAVVHSSTTYGFDCRLVADAVAQYPDRFTGVCSIDVLAPDAVEKMRHWLDHGCTGLRMFTTGSTMPGQAEWLNDPRTYPIWEFATEKKFPICLQVNPEGLGMVRDLVERFPAVTVILDHAGRPDLTDGPPYKAAQSTFDMASYKQISVKVTPSVLERTRKGKATTETYLRKLVEVWGVDRIAWGSNFPASAGHLTDLKKESEAAFSFLSPADLDKVMGGTALRLYPALA